MDIEDLVYNAGKKGRDQNGKSRKDARKEAVVHAAVAANMKSILAADDHSILTRSQDPALQKIGKVLDIQAKNPGVSRSAMASVNLMDDYIGVSPTDIANFRSANPLLEDFAVEVLESVAFDETRSASSLSSSLRKGKKASSKVTGKKENDKPLTGAGIDIDGNLVSTPSQGSNPNYMQRRKSFDELNYLYRAQIVKSQQKRPETKQQRLKAEINRKRLTRESNQNEKPAVASADDGAGTAAPKAKSKRDNSAVEKLSDERRKWRLVETAQDKKRREKRLHDSLIRMFELQVRLEEEQNAKKRVSKKGSAKRRNFFSMFRSSTQDAQESTVQTGSSRDGRTTGVEDAEKPEKRASLFDSLPRLF